MFNFLRKKTSAPSVRYGISAEYIPGFDWYEVRINEFVNGTVSRQLTPEGFLASFPKSPERPLPATFLVPFDVMNRAVGQKGLLAALSPFGMYDKRGRFLGRRDR